MLSFPILKFVVAGHSMMPTYKKGEVLLVSRVAYLFQSPKINDVVIISDGSVMMLKRISKIKDNKYFVIGDNNKDSLDSRNFGQISRKNIVGKVIAKI